MIEVGDIISHSQMGAEEGSSLQRGMNFRPRGKTSIFLMSIRKGAPYADRVEENGRILIYEGHDVHNSKNEPILPKSVDQPMYTKTNKLTSNGKFFEAAKKYKEGKQEAELIKVYEKIKSGIWVFSGVFKLIDAWIEQADARNVFKFKLEIVIEQIENLEIIKDDLIHNRMIPSSVKREVWKRDKGQCVECGSKDNLHFDHVLPFSKGGTSILTENVQILCARHNLQKSDKII
jgi:hypothetical protein